MALTSSNGTGKYSQPSCLLPLPHPVYNLPEVLFKHQVSEMNQEKDLGESEEALSVAALFPLR